MTDTEILNVVTSVLKQRVTRQDPLSPACISLLLQSVEVLQGEKRQPDINTYPGGLTITNNSPPIEPLYVYAYAADGSYKDGLYWMGGVAAANTMPPGYQYYVTCNNCGILYDFNKQPFHCQPTEMSDAQQQMACKPPTSSK